MKTIEPTDPCLSWRGAVSIETTARGVRPWRIDHHQRDLHGPELVEAAQRPAGVRLGFVSDTDRVELDIQVNGGNPTIDATVDATVDGEVIASTRATPAGTAHLGPFPPGRNEIEVWLPHTVPVLVSGLRIDEGAELASSERRSRRWLTYGSSITYSRFAASPSRTWSGIVARSSGLDLLNLGFADGCHLDPLIAMQIRDTPADVISLEVGINIYTSSSMSLRTYRSNLLGLLSLAREGHPDVPLIVISPIASPAREQTPSHPRILPGFARRMLWAQRDHLPYGTVGPPLHAIRNVTREAVHSLIDDGDRALRVIDGRQLLGGNNVGQLVDGLHPGPDGERHLADQFLHLALPEFDPPVL